MTVAAILGDVVVFFPPPVVRSVTTDAIVAGIPSLYPAIAGGTPRGRAILAAEISSNAGALGVPTH